MKSKRLLIAAMLGVIVILAAGCTKTNPTVFSWDYQGRHYVADSSSVIQGADTRILAYYSVTAVAIDGGSSQLAVGSYTLHGLNTSGKPYMLYAVVNSAIYSQSGTLTITYIDAVKISGTFSVTYTDGTIMTGTFTDIPIR